MRQAEPAVGLNRQPPQAGHEWIARAGKCLPGRLEHVEKGLLGLGPELLDGEVHFGS